MCARLLASFKADANIKAADLKKFRVSESKLYARGPIYVFVYKDKRYYVVDDYSLADNPKWVKDILLENNHLLEGGLVENPIPQADGAKYAAGLEGVEYYLWEESL